MKFGLNEMAFPHEERSRSIAAAADAGYDGVELSLDPDDALGDPEKLGELRELADNRGLEIPSVLTGSLWEFPLSSPSSSTRERALELGRDLVSAAELLGAERVLVVPAVVDSDTPYDEAYDNALAAVRELAGFAADRGVTIAIENVWNDFLYSPLEFRSFVESAAESGPAGAYFDVGNVRRFGYPEQWIALLEDHLVAIHVKDYDTAVDTIEGFTYPLQGDVNWDAVADALGDAGYDGWVTPEVAPYESHPARMPPQVLANLRAVFEGE